MTTPRTTPVAPTPSRPRTRRPALLLGACAVIASVALIAGCGDDPDDVAGEGTTSSSTTASPSTEGTSSSTPGGLDGAATTPVSVPYPQIETAQLTDVTVGGHDGYDRVVFTFDGELPGYDIGYVDGPVIEDGSGDTVPVGGTHAIAVRMNPASGVLLTAEQVETTYTGPDRLEGPGNPVVEVVRAGDFEAQATWAIGVDGERPFKVSTLADPTRIVVDVAAG